MLAELRAVMASGLMDPDAYADMHDKATGMAIHTVVSDDDDDDGPRRQTRRAAAKTPAKVEEKLSDGLAEIAAKRGGVPDWWLNGPSVAMQDATAPRKRAD